MSLAQPDAPRQRQHFAQAVLVLPAIGQDEAGQHSEYCSTTGTTYTTNRHSYPLSVPARADSALATQARYDDWWQHNLLSFELGWQRLLDEAQKLFFYLPLLLYASNLLAWNQNTLSLSVADFWLTITLPLFPLSISQQECTP